jgi:Lrp/AsnC family leucine-responsive transcriptional regulator
MDAADRHLLSLLQGDSRLTYEELGEAVGLSAPAAYQRVRKLEESGAVIGYHARVAPGAMGRGVVAFVHVTPGPGTRVDRLVEGWDATGDVLECHRVTGGHGYLLKLRLHSVDDLGPHLDAARRAGCAALAEVGLATLFERWTVPVWESEPGS